MFPERRMLLRLYSLSSRLWKCVCACVCAPAGSSQCIFKRRGLTFILVFHSQAMGGYGRGEEEEEEGGKGGGGGGGELCRAVEWSWELWRVHTQLRESRQRTSRAASQTHTSRQRRGGTQILKGGRRRNWEEEEKKTRKKRGQSAGMATYEPAYLPPNAEEQDFIQAYENVREKYKGGSAPALQWWQPHDDRWHVRACVFAGWQGFFFFSCCLLSVLLTRHRCKHVTAPCRAFDPLSCRRRVWVCACGPERDAASLDCWVLYWLAHMFAVTPPRCLSQRVLPQSGWIRGSGRLWYVTAAAIRLRWPLTTGALAAVWAQRWLLSRIQSQQRTLTGAAEPTTKLINGQQELILFTSNLHLSLSPYLSLSVQPGMPSWDYHSLLFFGNPGAEVHEDVDVSDGISFDIQSQSVLSATSAQNCV